MNQTSISMRSAHRWQILVEGSAAYLILAASALVIWKVVDAAPSKVADCLLWSCLASFAALLLAGGGLFWCRRPRWGWAAMVFGGVALMLFFFVLLPWLARAKAY